MIPVSSKEQSLYEGVITLLSQGKDLSAMTVSEIAAAAHIGKGTVYEYFSSREELLHKALLYSLYQELSALKNTILEADRFQDQCFAAFSWVAKSITQRRCAFQFFLSQGGAQLIPLEEYLLPFQHIEMIEEILDLLLETGQADGSIVPVTQRFYARMVLLSTLAGFCYSVSTFSRESAISLDQRIHYSYQMLLKALN